MLIDTGITIAYKCSACGSFEFFNLTLFTLCRQKRHSFACHCGQSGVVISDEKAKVCKLKMLCFDCGKEHTYSFERKRIFLGHDIAFRCPETNMRQCFIGNDRTIRKRVDSLEKELDELIDRFGYESYFKNTQVMYHSLNKIHDIAAEGNLLCECGNNEIDLYPLSDKICLICRKCSSVQFVDAASNEDLKEILMRRQILL